MRSGKKMAQSGETCAIRGASGVEPLGSLGYCGLVTVIYQRAALVSGQNCSPSPGPLHGELAAAGVLSDIGVHA
jgi:hypothetical protein